MLRTDDVPSYEQTAMIVEMALFVSLDLATGSVCL